MMDKGLINLILSLNSVLPLKLPGNEISGTHLEARHNPVVGKELRPWTSPRWNTLIYYFGIAGWWRTKLVSSLCPQHTLSISLIFHEILFHNRFVSLVFLLPFLSLFCQFLSHITFYQKQPLTNLSITSWIVDSLSFSIINFNC